MKTLLILLVITSTSFFSFSQNRTHASIYYGVEQGLPTTEIYWIIEDREGNIWFGTDVGVSKFDGYEFKNFTVKDGLTDHTIFHLYEDPLGRIWFLPFNSKLGYIKNDSVYIYPYNKKITETIKKSSWISKILVDSTNNLKYILANGSAGSISENGELTVDTRVNTHIEKSRKEKKKILIENQHNGIKFLSILQNNESNNAWQFIEDNTKIKTNFEFPNNGFFLESRLSKDSVFFSFNRSAGFKYKSFFKTINFGKPTLGFTINAAGNLWVQVGSDGIYIFESTDAFLNFEQPIYKLFEGQDISCVLHTKNGQVWICSNKQGVYYFQNEYITIYSHKSNSNSNKITSLFMNKKEEVFYSNGDGKIFKIKKNGKHEEIINNCGYITQFSIGKQEKLTISTFNINKVIEQTKGKKINYIFVGRKFIKTKKNEFWQIVNGGVQKIENKKIVFDSEPTLGKYFFHSIFEDNKGQIWLGGNEGLFIISNNNFIPIKKPFIHDIKVQSINQLKNGTMLIASASRGLYLLQKNKKGYKINNIPLTGYHLREIHIDSKENVWLATNKGVVIVNQIEPNSYSIRTISHLHGLPSDEVNAVITCNNNVYIATKKGLAVLNRSILNKNINKIKLRIENIKVNEKTVKKDSVLSLNYSQNYIEFFYTGMLFKNPGEVLYAYKLEGIDTKWHFTKARNVRYTSLSPNTYKFTIKAANEDGVWSEPILIKFTISPPFWEEKSFLFLCLISGIIISFLIHKKIKNNRKKKHENAQELELHKRKIVEVELKALRAQMNPHFTFNTLNSIQAFITKFDREKANKYISEFSLLLRKVLEKSRYTTITIDEEVEMLRLYLNLENLRFKNSIDYKIIIDPNLDSCFQEIPSMIIQPFVENAIIHGLSGKKEGSKTLTIELKQKQNDIICIVQDSGIGREKAAENKRRKMLEHVSLGMKITTERLQFFNKEKDSQLSFSIIDLKNKEGIACGTRVEIVFRDVL